MKTKLLIIIAVILGISFSCDTIEEPYLENPGALFSTVTLFEFTGINCVYCPQNGHEVVSDYMDKFGKNLQAVSIHGNEFGEEIDGFMLRTQEGQELAKEMLVNGLPKGAVNSFNSEAVNVPSALGGDIAKYGYKFPDLLLDVEMTIENDTIAIVTIDGRFDEILSTDYKNLNICVYLIQNEIEGPQKDIRGDREEYTHKHALRKPFNGIFGSEYVTNPTGGMVVDALELSLNLNEANLNFKAEQTIENLHIEPFVFVYNTENKEMIPLYINYK